MGQLKEKVVVSSTKAAAAEWLMDDLPLRLYWKCIPGSEKQTNTSNLIRNCWTYSSSLLFSLYFDSLPCISSFPQFFWINNLEVFQSVCLLCDILSSRHWTRHQGKGSETINRIHNNLKLKWNVELITFCGGPSGGWAVVYECNRTQSLWKMNR